MMLNKCIYYYEKNKHLQTWIISVYIFPSFWSEYFCSSCSLKFQFVGAALAVSKIHSQTVTTK